MATVKDRLKNLVAKLRAGQKINPETIERAKRTIAAAKATAKEKLT